MNVRPADAPKKYMAKSSQNCVVRSIWRQVNSGRAAARAAAAPAGGCTRWPSGGLRTRRASTPTTIQVRTPRAIIVSDTPFSTAP